MQAREFPGRRHHRSMDCRSLRLNYAVAASRVTSSVSRKASPFCESSAKSAKKESQLRPAACGDGIVQQAPEREL
jgi:hypothetical protein